MEEGKTILLVDDDSRNVFALSKILKERGMEVIKAENGKDALEMLSTHPDIALVLMDIMMPGYNGFKAMKKIIAEFPDARIAVVTNYNDKQYRALALQIGAKAYVLKEDLIELRDICEINKNMDINRV